MKLIMLSTLVFLTACTNIPKHDVVYSSHYANDYTTAVLNKCRSEADMLTFMIAEGKIARGLASGETITREDVDQFRNMLVDTCVKHFKIDI